MEIETNVNPDDDWNDAQWIEDEIDTEDAKQDQANDWIQERLDKYLCI